MQSFTPPNLAFSSSNGGCGDYFHLHLNNQTDQIPQQNLQQQQQPFVSQYSTGGTSSQTTDMLANHSHNVISYQPQVPIFLTSYCLHANLAILFLKLPIKIV